MLHAFYFGEDIFIIISFSHGLIWSADVRMLLPIYICSHLSTCCSPISLLLKLFALEWTLLLVIEESKSTWLNVMKNVTCAHVFSQLSIMLRRWCTAAAGIHFISYSFEEVSLLAKLLCKLFHAFQSIC